MVPGATRTSCKGKSLAPNICLAFVCLSFPFLPCLPLCFHPSICTGLKIGPWPDSACASSAWRGFGVIPFHQPDEVGTGLTSVPQMPLSCHRCQVGDCTSDFCSVLCSQPKMLNPGCGGSQNAPLGMGDLRLSLMSAPAWGEVTPTPKLPL